MIANYIMSGAPKICIGAGGGYDDDDDAECNAFSQFYLNLFCVNNELKVLQ